MSIKKFQSSAAGYMIHADVTLIGKDLLISVTGGDAPHIGTITTISRDCVSETIRFHSHHGRFHKDNILSDIILEHIKTDLLGNCVITAGVHIDYITEEQIKASVWMAEQLAIDILAWLRQINFSN